MLLPNTREEEIMSLNDPHILYCMQLGMENLRILVIFNFSGTFDVIPRTNVQYNT
jgi:hypothetical protein